MNNQQTYQQAFKEFLTLKKGKNDADGRPASPPPSSPSPVPTEISKYTNNNYFKTNL